MCKEEKPIFVEVHSSDTYSVASKQDLADGSSPHSGDTAPRKRRRTSPLELAILEARFRECSKPCRQDREQIAAEVGMTPDKVQIWFQNKRQSCRRQLERRPLGRADDQQAPTRTASMPASGVFSLRTTPTLPPPPTFARDGAPKDEIQGSIRSQQLGVAKENEPPHHKRGVRLTMNADGKAQLVMRSPLKSVNQNQLTPQPPQRFASLPSPRSLNKKEHECAANLLFLKSGRWH